jgi:hypothetical protein
MHSNLRSARWVWYTYHQRWIKGLHNYASLSLGSPPTNPSQFCARKLFNSNSRTDICPCSHRRITQHAHALENIKAHNIIVVRHFERKCCYTITHTELFEGRSLDESITGLNERYVTNFIIRVLVKQSWRVFRLQFCHGGGFFAAKIHSLKLVFGFCMSVYCYVYRYISVRPN